VNYLWIGGVSYLNFYKNPLKNNTEMYPSAEELAQLLPQYEIHHLLGVGGMGAVYLGHQTNLDRWVAIKLMPIETSSNPVEAERFRQEAKSMAKMVHPHIVACFDFGQTPEGHFYLVMEYVQGEDLHMRTARGEINQPRARKIILQLCEALQYAHTNGVIHRDIKPANILITEDWQVKVADFGLAQEMTHLPSDDEIEFGTPDYVAPERLVIGAVVDQRADIYALGVVIHEMLTGLTPKAAGADAGKGLPDSFIGVLSKCLMKDPAKRYQNATEVKMALVLAIEEEKKIALKAINPNRIKPAPANQAANVAKAKQLANQRITGQMQRSSPKWPVIVMSIVLIAAAGYMWVKMQNSSESDPVPSADPIATLPQAGANRPGMLFFTEGHSAPITSLFLLDDQQTLLTSSLDGNLIRWNKTTKTTEPPKSILIGEIQIMNISADYSHLIMYAKESSKISIVATENLKRVMDVPAPTTELIDLHLLADLQQVALITSQVNKGLYHWNSQSADPAKPIEAWPYTGLGADINGQGELVVLGKKADGSILGESKDLELLEINTTEFKKIAKGVKTSFSGVKTAIIFDDGFAVYDKVKASFTSPIKLQGISLVALELTGNDKLILTSWSDQSIRLFDLSTNKEVYREVLPGVARHIEVSKNGSWAAFALETPKRGLLFWQLPKDLGLSENSQSANDIKVNADQKDTSFQTKIEKNTENNNGQEAGKMENKGKNGLTNSNPYTLEAFKNDTEVYSILEPLFKRDYSSIEPALKKTMQDRKDRFVAELEPLLNGLSAEDKELIENSTRMMKKGGKLDSKMPDATPDIKALRANYEKDMLSLENQLAEKCHDLVTSIRSQFQPLVISRLKANDNAGSRMAEDASRLMVRRVLATR
jgi:serine/threonine protein kinase